MGLGMAGQFIVYHNGNVIRQLGEYDYFEDIIRPIERRNQNV